MSEKVQFGHNDNPNFLVEGRGDEETVLVPGPVQTVDWLVTDLLALELDQPARHSSLVPLGVRGDPLLRVFILVQTESPGPGPRHHQLPVAVFSTSMSGTVSCYLRAAILGHKEPA